MARVLIRNTKASLCRRGFIHPFVTAYAPLDPQRAPECGCLPIAVDPDARTKRGITWRETFAEFGYRDTAPIPDGQAVVEWPMPKRQVEAPV